VITRGSACCRVCLLAAWGWGVRPSPHARVRRGKACLAAAVRRSKRGKGLSACTAVVRGRASAAERLARCGAVRERACGAGEAGVVRRNAVKVTFFAARYLPCAASRCAADGCVG